MRTALVILGIILLIAGLVFVGQGSGYFPYPASSFMIRETNWVYYGGGIGVGGVFLICPGRGHRAHHPGAPDDHLFRGQVPPAPRSCGRPRAVEDNYPASSAATSSAS